MNLEAMRNAQFANRRLRYETKDTILYALSVGAGSDPLDRAQLRLVYERDLLALPSFAAVLAHPGAWIARPEFGVNFLKLLHGEQYLAVHKPLAPSAEIEASYRVAAVVDKGEGKGALVYFEKALREAESGEPLCTVTSTLFLRADGGCGSFGMAPAPLPAEPENLDGFAAELRTPIGSALLYRLNGDLNPIHVDPESAVKAGFERPILHGLCTYGVAGLLLVQSACGNDPRRLRSLDVRFTSPVYPGETIRIEGVHDGDGVRFRALVPERRQPVLGQGHARIAAVA